MRIKTLLAECRALQYSEAVLLVNNNKTQFMELHPLLNQSVRSNHYVYGTVLNFLTQALLIGLAQTTS
jgi:hypothetical protein